MKKLVIISILFILSPLISLFAQGKDCYPNCEDTDRMQSKTVIQHQTKVIKPVGVTTVKAYRVQVGMYNIEPKVLCVGTVVDVQSTWTIELDGTLKKGKPIWVVYYAPYYLVREDAIYMKNQIKNRCACDAFIEETILPLETITNPNRQAIVVR